MATLTRREFAHRIAQDYAAFALDVARHHGGTPMPLDREYVFSAGRRLIEAGEYAPRGDWRYMDRAELLRTARRHLPAAERFVAQVHDDWEHACRACGGPVRYRTAEGQAA